MAKIIKIGSQNTTLTSKTANLAKTSRQGNITNPFKFSNFEGNTLQFADVFEGFEPKKQNKLRMIATSVTGSMNKMRTGITEPIKNFVNRVRGAWDYATNKELFVLPGEKEFRNFMTAERHLPSIDIDGLKMIGKDFSTGIIALNNDIKSMWSGLISIIHTNKYSDMSVSELEQAWLNEYMEGAA